MPRPFRILIPARPLLCLALAGLFQPLSAGPAASAPGVAVLYDAAWSPGDAVRDGAIEFSLLLHVAQLRRGHSLAGLVCVGNRQGTFRMTTEDTLGRVALMGVPVVKVAQGEPLPANADDVFIEAGTLTPAAAQQLLAECLAHFGAPPAARDPAHPTAGEIDAVRSVIARYQGTFDAASSGAARLAMR